MQTETQNKIDELVADTTQCESFKLDIVSAIVLQKYQLNKYKYQGYAPRTVMIWERTAETLTRDGLIVAGVVYGCARFINGVPWTEIFPGALEEVDFEGTEQMCSTSYFFR